MPCGYAPSGAGRGGRAGCRSDYGVYCVVSGERNGVNVTVSSVSVRASMFIFRWRRFEVSLGDA
jgi:hypothetical protein